MKNQKTNGISNFTEGKNYFIDGNTAMSAQLMVNEKFSLKCNSVKLNKLLSKIEQLAPNCQSDKPQDTILYFSQINYVCLLLFSFYGLHSVKRSTPGPRV